MSQSASADESRPYAWTETEWYDHAEGRDCDREDPDAVGRHHDSYDGSDRLAWIAHDILKASGRLLCSTTLTKPPDRGWSPHMAAEGYANAPDHDPTAMHHERRDAELSEPRVPLGKTAGEDWGTAEYGHTGHDHRVTEEVGYFSGGESTGIIIADRPTEEFLAVIDLVVATKDLRPSVADHVRAFAREQKEHGQKHDKDLLRDVLARIEAAERGEAAD